MFSCRFCNFTTSRVDKKIKHRAVQRNVIKGYHCDYKKCKRVCPSEKSLRSHIARVHSLQVLSNTVTVPDIPQTAFLCSVTICKQSCDSFAKLIKHLCGHIENDGIRIACPFENCSKSYSSAVSQHLQGLHPPLSTLT